MKKKTIIILTIIILIFISTTVYLLITHENNLIKLNYNKVIEKVENKEDFVLCVSASDCIHCQEYKPKLKKNSK